jgi:hypothetical protein
MSTTNFSNEPGTAQDTRFDEPAAAGTQADTGAGDPAKKQAKEQAKEAAGAAADEGKRVAGVAQDEAQRVTAEARDQLRGLVSEATTQLDEQSKAQQTRLAGTVRTFGDDLDAMTAEGHDDGVAAQLVRQVADQARGLASQLEDREPKELLEDMRSFARRKPGTFLLGALAAGVVVGRLTRGAKAAQDDTPGGDAQTSATGTRTASAPPVAPAAPVDPVGPKGVEMSESGVVDSDGGRA